MPHCNNLCSLIGQGREMIPGDRNAMAQVCEMHRQLEDIRNHTNVYSIPIYDAQWRTWLLPVRLVAKVLFLIFLNDNQDSGSVHYNEPGHAVKLLWGGGIHRVYFVEIKDRRAMEEPFHLQASITTLLSRITSGLERVLDLTTGGPHPHPHQVPEPVPAQDPPPVPPTAPAPAPDLGPQPLLVPAPVAEPAQVIPVSSVSVHAPLRIIVVDKSENNENEKKEEKNEAKKRKANCSV